MNWHFYESELQDGKQVQFRPHGNSMEPKIHSGNLVTINPITEADSLISKGDIVFCKVHGTYYVHLVESVHLTSGGYRYQIRNNKGHINGVIGQDSIFGKVVKIDD
jgi:phage repressor protein C with HTH and peptisase S24 domain